MLDGVACVRSLPSTASLSYLGAIPGVPRIDGGFAEWSSTIPDAVGEASTRGNANIDVAHLGAIPNAPSLYLYMDVSGRMFAGTSQPDAPQPAPLTNATPVADTDRDTVPDTLDPMPFDFNNDGTPDARTNGDYDGDGITDYGFPGGTDAWLNTTLPASFPAPYAGLSVSVYIGPTVRPPALGEDVLRFFLDIDNRTSTGFSIGGIGADRLVEIHGKDAQVSQSALLAFTGSYPGEWSWSAISPVTVATGARAVELAVNLSASRVYLEMGDFWGGVDASSPVSPATLAVASLSSMTSSSFRQAPATSALAVPWYQDGPQASATLIDPGSSSSTSLYNQQRKVVRAPDVAGQTGLRCDERGRMLVRRPERSAERGHVHVRSIHGDRRHRHEGVRDVLPPASIRATTRTSSTARRTQAPRRSRPRTRPQRGRTRYATGRPARAARPRTTHTRPRARTTRYFRSSPSASPSRAGPRLPRSESASRRSRRRAETTRSPASSFRGTPGRRAAATRSRATRSSR